MREFSVCVFFFSGSSNSAKLLVGDKDCEEKKVSEHLGLLYSGKAFSEMLGRSSKAPGPGCYFPVNSGVQVSKGPRLSTWIKDWFNCLLRWQDRVCWLLKIGKQTPLGLRACCWAERAEPAAKWAQVALRPGSTTYPLIWKISIHTAPLMAKSATSQDVAAFLHSLALTGRTDGQTSQQYGGISAPHTGILTPRITQLWEELLPAGVWCFSL